MPFSKPPIYVDLANLVFVKEVPYEALPRRFLKSSIISHHIIPRENFSLSLAKSISAERFRLQPDRSAHTVMPRPRAMLLYKHAKTNKHFLKCTFPLFQVYTFFKEIEAGKSTITAKIELEVSIYFTTSGHLSYVHRLTEQRARQRPVTEVAKVAAVAATTPQCKHRRIRRRRKRQKQQAAAATECRVH